MKNDDDDVCVCVCVFVCVLGVYISKMSYVREGEHSLDGFYRPYHTVTYYRYLHFFSDGEWLEVITISLFSVCIKEDIFEIHICYDTFYNVLY